MHVHQLAIKRSLSVLFITFVKRQEALGRAGKRDERGRAGAASGQALAGVKGGAERLAGNCISIANEQER